MRQATKAAASAPLLAAARPSVPPTSAAARNLSRASTSAGSSPRAPGRSQRRAFSASARSRAAADEPPPPQHGRSPWAAFKETLKAELAKSREWQDTAKQLGGEVGKVQDSATMRRARELYEKARVRAG